MVPPPVKLGFAVACLFGGIYFWRRHRSSTTATLDVEEEEPTITCTVG